MRHRVARALSAAVLLLSFAAPVLSHSQLLSATPGPGDTVIGSPVELVAQFSQNLDPSRTSLEVRDASGAQIVRGGELGTGPREFRLTLPELAPGTYEVRWTSYSTEDQEIGRDTYTFEVIAAPSPSPTRSPTPSASSRETASPSVPPSPSPPQITPSPSPGPGSTPGSSGTDGSVVIPIVVALALVGAFGLWALRRPRA